MADQEKHLFGSIEPGVPAPMPEPHLDKPLNEQYAPRDAKPDAYFIYDNGVPVAGYQTAYEAYVEFRDYEPESGHSREHVELREWRDPGEAGKRLASWETFERENTRTFMYSTRPDVETVYRVKLEDDMKRDLVSEGRHPHEPEKALSSPEQAAAESQPSAEPAKVEDDMTAEDLMAREAARRPLPAQREAGRESETAAAPRGHSFAQLRQQMLSGTTSGNMQPPVTAPQDSRPQSQTDPRELGQDVRHERAAQERSEREAVSRERSHDARDEALAQQAQRESEAIAERAARQEEARERESRERTVAHEQQSRTHVANEGDARQADAIARQNDTSILMNRARREIQEGIAPTAEMQAWHKVVQEENAGRDWRPAYIAALAQTPTEYGGQPRGLAAVQASLAKRQTKHGAANVPSGLKALIVAAQVVSAESRRPAGLAALVASDSERQREATPQMNLLLRNEQGMQQNGPDASYV